MPTHPCAKSLKRLASPAKSAKKAFIPPSTNASLLSKPARAARRKNQLSPHQEHQNSLNKRIPKGFRLKAQGCRACEATLGLNRQSSTTLKGCALARSPTVHGTADRGKLS